ncbi:hypothetical protein BY996DRAFT_8690483 [Phakopsora pachyrhizi]|nr:hypothetical protein BY996DRAFT_8690483 [Phakopsora pachyrhizi]
MPNFGSLETPTNLSLATPKKTSSKTSLPPNSSSASKPAGLGAKKTKLKPSTKDCGKNGSPRVLKTQSSISSKLISPSIGSSINSRLAKRESLVVSKATISSSIKSSASACTLVKKGTTINVEKRRLMIEINSRWAMARTGENKISYFTIPPWGTYLSGDITYY